MKKGELEFSREYPILQLPVAKLQRPATHFQNPDQADEAIVPRPAAQLVAPSTGIELTRTLPQELAASLSNIEDIEAELSPYSGNGDAQ